MRESLTELSAEVSTLHVQYERHSQMCFCFVRLSFSGALSGMAISYSLNMCVGQVKILASIQHRHILAFLGLCHYYDLKSEMSSIVLVTEWCPATLRAWIRETSSSRERLRLDALQIVEEIAMGMRYLHDDCGIIHRDLKPENVLLSGDVRFALLLRSPSWWCNKRYWIGEVVARQQFFFVGFLFVPRTGCGQNMRFRHVGTEGTSRLRWYVRQVMSAPAPFSFFAAMHVCSCSKVGKLATAPRQQQKEHSIQH